MKYSEKAHFYSLSFPQIAKNINFSNQELVICDHINGRYWSEEFNCNFQIAETVLSRFVFNITIIFFIPALDIFKKRKPFLINHPQTFWPFVILKKRKLLLSLLNLADNSFRTTLELFGLLSDGI